MEAVQQDQVFWHQAYREHGGAVLAFLRARSWQREEVEDLLQETFVRAIRAGSFQPGGNLRGYLLSVARNLVINSLRRPRLVVPVRENEDGSGGLEAVASEAASPEELLGWRGFSQDLATVLANMSPTHAEAFHLGLVQQLSYREIAQRTGWSMPQVKVNIYRARRKAIDQLGHHLDGERGSR